MNGRSPNGSRGKVSHPARLALAFVLAGALVSALNPTSTARVEPPVGASLCPGQALLPYLGTACPTEGGWILEGPDGFQLRVHGTDPPVEATCLTDLDENGVPEANNGGGDDIPGGGPCPPERVPACAASTTDQRVELLYMVPSGGTDQYGQAQSVLPRSLALANGAFWREANAFGYDADVRTTCVDGEVHVEHILLDLTDQQAQNQGLVAIARDLGYTDSRVKYVLAYQGAFRAFGTMYADDRLAADNAHNTAAGYAVIPYNLRWETLLHELGHTLGAVQYSAPHSTRHAGHCIEGQDYMCYDDRVTDPPNPWTPASLRAHVTDMATRPFVPVRCVDRDYFDCGHDDYFHPEPAPGSYLATHWNIASSYNGFLEIEPAA